MNTSKIIGSLFFIVSGAWLFAIHAHPLVLLFLRATRRCSFADPLRDFPFPPDYYGRFSWETWWPALLGVTGVAVGTVLIALSRRHWVEDAEQTLTHRKDRTREF